MPQAMGLQGAVRGRAWITTTEPAREADRAPDPVRRLPVAHAADARAASARGVPRTSDHGSLKRARWDWFFTSSI